MLTCFVQPGYYNKIIDTRSCIATLKHTNALTFTNSNFWTESWALACVDVAVILIGRFPIPSAFSLMTKDFEEFGLMFLILLDTLFTKVRLSSTSTLIVAYTPVKNML